MITTYFIFSTQPLFVLRFYKCLHKTTGFKTFLQNKTTITILDKFTESPKANDHLYDQQLLTHQIPR